MRLFFSSVFCLIILNLASCIKPIPEKVMPLDNIAEKYVKLTLEIGQYDPDFVDAYYGPEEWKPEEEINVDSSGIPYEELKWKATELHMTLEELDISSFDSLDVQRYRFLVNQLIAIKTKLDMISGEFLPFDVESRALYDAVTPHYEKEYYDDLLKKLSELLPGSGSLNERYEKYSSQFIIPNEKLDTVFQTAIEEARKRTLKHLSLPENESFNIEYVTDKPWSGYNWYKGNSYSLIQINTDFPIYIERAIDLACHEGYPGHHVYNAMLEKILVRDKGWVEFSIYPLFSPQSLIAEGSANFGIEVAFSSEERRRFEKETLFPLAGINPTLVDDYYDMQELRDKLSFAGNEAAKKYLDGKISREEAAKWLVKYNLFTLDRALQRTRFFDKYRSYVINYNYGKYLVKNYVESNGGTEENLEKRWKIFSEILSSPISASMIE